MSRWHYHQKECEYCGNEFEASRYDARFCPGSKCRTANSRREKRREQAKGNITVEWQKISINMYVDIKEQLPATIQNMILDTYIQNGSAAAEATTTAVWTTLNHISNRTKVRIHEKDRLITTLESQVELLNAIKSLLQ